MMVSVCALFDALDVTDPSSFGLGPWFGPTYYGILLASTVDLIFRSIPKFAEIFDYWIIGWTFGFSAILYWAGLDRQSTFTRKHGRWRHRNFFPVAFLVLSCLSCTASTAAFMARAMPAALPVAAAAGRKDAALGARDTFGHRDQALSTCHASSRFHWSF